MNLLTGLILAGLEKKRILKVQRLINILRKKSLGLVNVQKKEKAFNGVQ